MNELKMTLGRKVALGAGDFGFNLYWQMASIYLLYFYTDVVGLPPAIAGTIYMAALIWDAVLDPVMGLVADRTRTRYGRYRPYLLFGGIPLALAFAAMFVVPSGSGMAAVIFTATTHVIFRTIYAVLSIPYASLFARVTRDARIRADLTGFRMVFATLSAVLVAGATLPFVNGLATPDSPRRGWIILALGFGLLATAIFVLVAWATKGHDASEETETEPRRSGAEVVKSLLSNRALLIVLGAVMITSFSSTLFGKNLLYYFKYVLDQPKIGSSALAFVALLAGLFVPFWTWVARRFGKRNAWLWGAIPGLLGLVSWHLIDGSSVPLLFGALALQAVSSSSFIVCFWSMLPDTVEYGEWRSGVRTESMVFGLATLGQKMALGFGAGFLGLALAHVGYVSNAHQTAETIEGIKQMMFWIPLAGGLITVTLIAFYPLSLKAHAKMVEEIAARNRATPSG
ncbi:MFS transporter [Stenotrophobium rhamnosiphilum]|uniref:Glycoside transporter n=1 Tax=Stenotrophobium rhamnosiphilum TaxID=2029166 RepID=A0A2T5MD82_9GAMM|nr:glycoside-pentoside-hexuronide (GPH):cation symporter [Stenotrophobium rhamnosiphilum]PTU30534.1 glycoside transporter [Stenotrophobium rhamnosiphilum]